jgi:ferredoxin
MSGTGNTYRMACWIKEIISPYEITPKIIMIEDADFESDFNQSSETLVGTLFPTHGFMPPWSMIKFLFKMPKRPGVSAMCAATRGALKLGPLYVPGASGFATFLAAILMFIKGYDIRAVFSLDMPSNLTNFHWGLHPQNVDKISYRCRTKLTRLMSRILNGRKILFTRNNLWELLWCALILWLIPLLPILYLIFARMFMAKVMFSNNSCVGCGRCARSCPNNGILMKDVGEKTPRPYWTYHCENCMRCMGYCRKKAVEAGHSWAVLLYFITSVPVLAYVFEWLHETVQIFPMIKGYWTLNLFNVVYFLPALFLSYWIFWYLIRVPIINTFFSYTTLTHYYRRYHEPETKLRNMAGNKGKAHG